MLERRAVLAGLAGLSIAATPATALPAVAAPKSGASSEPTTSPEAAALRAEFKRLSTEYRTACREADEAGERITYPDIPEAVYWRPGDTVRLGFRSPSKSWLDGRNWYGDHKMIEDLRAAPFRYMSGRLDEQGSERRDEIVDAWDSWQAATQAAEDVAGSTAAEARFASAFEAYQAFRTRLVELRTADPEIMTLKAQLVLERAVGSEGVERMIARALKSEGAQEEAVAMSLVRDFIGLLGAAHREGNDA